MAQQTAVEWMIDEIDIAYPDIEIKKKISITAQAKEMEKQQHKYTWYDSRVNTCIPFDNYYNETYNK